MVTAQPAGRSSAMGNGGARKADEMIAQPMRPAVLIGGGETREQTEAVAAVPGPGKHVTYVNSEGTSPASKSNADGLPKGPTTIPGGPEESLGKLNKFNEETLDVGGPNYSKGRNT